MTSRSSVAPGTILIRPSNSASLPTLCSRHTATTAYPRSSACWTMYLPSFPDAPTMQILIPRVRLLASWPTDSTQGGWHELPSHQMLATSHLGTHCARGALRGSCTPQSSVALRYGRRPGADPSKRARDRPSAAGLAGATGDAVLDRSQGPSSRSRTSIRRPPGRGAWIVARLGNPLGLPL